MKFSTEKVMSKINIEFFLCPLTEIISGQALIYLFGVLCCFQHYTGHITTGSWKGRGNQYIQLVKVLYCKLLTNGKQLPAFPLEVGPGTEPRSQRWESRVLPLCHRGPSGQDLNTFCVLAGVGLDPMKQR